MLSAYRQTKLERFRVDRGLVRSRTLLSESRHTIGCGENRLELVVLSFQFFKKIFSSRRTEGVLHTLRLKEEIAVRFQKQLVLSLLGGHFGPLESSLSAASAVGTDRRRLCMLRKALPSSLASLAISQRISRGNRPDVLPKQFRRDLPPSSTLQEWPVAVRIQCGPQCRLAAAVSRAPSGSGLNMSWQSLIFPRSFL